MPLHMRHVEQKLHSWHKVYQDLQAARTRLQSAQCGSSEPSESLEDEVRQLQCDSDCALAEVQALLSRRSLSGAAP